MPAIATSLSLLEWRRVDALCDQFETDWQQQRRPRIEEYLARAEEQSRPALASELLRIEMEWRLQVGEQPSAGEYATRYPALTGSLPDFLAAARQAFEARTAAATAAPLETCAVPAGAGPALPPQTLEFVTPGPTSVAAGEAVRHVGEYDLIEPIGEGGMGQVWKARHRRLGKLVALKLIRPGNRGSPSAVHRFLREMKAIGDLDHPHVVEASDAGESDGTVYLAMKLIDGQDLAKYVRERGSLSIAEGCGLARQVAVGLQYLHERGLVHRDLKPGNLISTPDGTVKILDLGLARWHADELSEGPTEQTQAGEGLGTPDYMAPEQIGQAATVDVRADLYALGATLFHLLTGRAPFGHLPSKFEKMKAHEIALPADVRTLRPDVPGELAALIARLMAKRPEDRPATPAEVADALAPFAVREPTATAAIGPVRPLRRRWPIWVGGGVAAALVVGGALTLTLGPRLRTSGPPPEKQPEIAERPLPKARVGPPTVLRFDVRHTALDDEPGVVGVERGLFGGNSFSARVGDRAKVSVVLSRRAHGYLIAYATDGKEFLLDPPAETQPPAAAEELVYPQAGERLQYEFTEGVGLHVFLAVVSSEPLPPYAEWRSKHGVAPWGKAPGRRGAVWRQVGGDLHVTTAGGVDVRGPGAVELGAAPVERLASWWKKQPGIVEVGLTGLPVMKAE